METKYRIREMLADAIGVITLGGLLYLFLWLTP